MFCVLLIWNGVSAIFSRSMRSSTYLHLLNWSLFTWAASQLLQLTPAHLLSNPDRFDKLINGMTSVSVSVAIWSAFPLGKTLTNARSDRFILFLLGMVCTAIGLTNLSYSFNTSPFSLSPSYMQLISTVFLCPFFILLLLQMRAGSDASSTQHLPIRKMAITTISLLGLGGLLVLLNPFRLHTQSTGIATLSIGVTLLSNIHSRSPVPFARFLRQILTVMICSLLGGILLYVYIRINSFSEIPEQTGRSYALHLAAFLAYFSGMLLLILKPSSSSRVHFQQTAYERISNALQTHLESISSSLQIVTDLLERNIQKSPAHPLQTKQHPESTEENEPSQVLSSGGEEKNIPYYTNQMQNAVGELKTLVQGMKFLSAPSNLQKQSVELVTLVQQNSRQIQAIDKWKNVDFILDSPADLPAVTASRKGLKRVLLELMSNAAEAVVNCKSPGSRDIRIQLSYQQGLLQNTISFSITDQGEPLPDTSLELLKAPFYSTRPEHFGLGLTLVDRILRSHNTELHIHQPKESSREKTFSFQIPVNQK